ncbi:MAG: UDP-glucose/GDP-mannose dehydrogenase family protein [Planctomycetes bacterium]|nr:UDP-glucose/GDP-mannose dehydrogenase family protein [Planctomycetota bacterium]
MRICVVGVGYVGLVTGTCFADLGHDVICVDNDQEKIDGLNATPRHVPIYEPGLSELVDRNVKVGRLQFTTDLAQGVEQSLVNFITVGTPTGEDGRPDTSAVFAVARGIGQVMNDYKIIVTKSTVPVGTTEKVRDTIAGETKTEFDVVSNPEFLKEGTAIEDFSRPDRIIIGADDVRVEHLMRELYAPLVRTGNPIIVMDIRSAEMTKYASNAMLATRISFMNEIANLCSRLGADVDHVRRGVGSDSRIGGAFLFSGVGFGGSCFPKDVRAIVAMGEEAGEKTPIACAVTEVNGNQPERIIGKILSHFDGDVKGKTFAVWGLAFKPKTDDVREAPALKIIRRLWELGAAVRAFDPEAEETAKKALGSDLVVARSGYDALDGAEALVLVTEWNEFRQPDFARMKQLLKQPVIFDGRNVYDREKMSEEGFTYYSIGRPVERLE